MEGYATEEQQVDALKKFWQKRGKLIITLISLIAITLGVMKYYKHHNSVKAINASNVYQNMLNGFSKKNMQTIKTNASLLHEKYKSTAYWPYATFTLAKYAMQDNDLAQAKQLLGEVIDSKNHEHIKAIARTRLAKILYKEEKLEDALQVLSFVKNDKYITIYEELKGDILLKQNKKDSAKLSYQKALDNAPEGFVTSILEMKIRNI
jgi:predicted negative regulator of RcsB-dependent stress response